MELAIVSILTLKGSNVYRINDKRNSDPEGVVCKKFQTHTTTFGVDLSLISITINMRPPSESNSKDF